jgi:hypothetical protein
MTDEKKKDDKDRKKLSDEELEDVAGGTVGDLTLLGRQQWGSASASSADPSQDAKKRAEESR